LSGYACFCSIWFIASPNQNLPGILLSESHPMGWDVFGDPHDLTDIRLLNSGPKFSTTGAGDEEVIRGDWNEQTRKKYIGGASPESRKKDHLPIR